MMTIRDFLELACDDSYMVMLYNMSDDAAYTDIEGITAEISELLSDDRYDVILDSEIESWDYVPHEGFHKSILEINYSWD